MRDAQQQIERELSYLRSKFMAIYDPRTAFGNQDLIDLLHEIDGVLAHREEVRDADACRNCEGTGRTLHECDCDLCTEKWIDCENCDGRGYIIEEARGPRRPREMAKDFHPRRI